jgi:hypothetical protein
MTDNSRNMRQRVLTVVLLVGLSFGLITLVAAMTSWRLPDREQGYTPKQPIDYSHRLHAGELQIDCRFCHSAVEKSRYAGIPSTDVCMKCHKVVTSSFEVLQDEIKKADERKKSDAKLIDAVGAPDAGEGKSKAAKPTPFVSDELRKLYDAFALDENLQPIPGQQPKSIPWVRVHDLPDYVYFDHRAHMAAGVTCQKCHGTVETMQRVHQHESLSMGWCVNCHREATKHGIDGKAVHASTDCAVCHY